MPSASSFVSTEFIYLSAPYPSCHASTIAETSPGHLVAAWFGGTNEGNPDVCIYLSKCSNGGRWTKPIEVASGVPEGQGEIPNPGGAGTTAAGNWRNRHPCYNPVLFQTRAGPLLLFYKVGPSPARWWGMAKASHDGGRSWSKPRRLPSGILGPIKNKPIELADGTILCPSSSEARGWTVHLEATRDLGTTWTATGPLNDPDSIAAIQPSILKLDDGRLHLVGRTEQGRLFGLDSTRPLDSAAPACERNSWGPMRLTALPNPNSGTDAVTLRDGSHMLVYNPTVAGRTPLVVATSRDAERWQNILTLEEAPGEYSYPAIIQSADGLIHITYTWKRTRIKHAVVDPTLAVPDPNSQGYFR
ncbi:MAG: sialidase family protein [Fimbriimonadaceae bacterium]